MTTTQEQKIPTPPDIATKGGQQIGRGIYAACLRIKPPNPVVTP